jgi:hypothetical protein
MIQLKMAPKTAIKPDATVSRAVGWFGGGVGGVLD